VQSLEMAVRVNEGNAWAHIHLGQVLYRYDAQRAAEVDEEFALALSLQPGESRIWGALIHFWVREGEVERAESLYLQGQQEGIVLSREDLLAWGEQAYRAGAYQEALRWYERVEVLEQGLQSRVLYLEYLTLTEDGDTGSAVAKLQEAVSLNQGWLDEGMRFEAWYLWGVYLYEEGRGVEAEDALTKAIAAHPQGEELQWEHSEAYRLLGLVQQAQGKLGQAVQSLEMAVRVNEGNAWAHIHLGQVLYRYDPRRAPEVEKEFSTGLSLRSSDVGLWRSLIGFWLRVRETDRAASLCLQAREKGIVSGLEEVCPAS
jgi:tetratricopeptide (TPR) repeat protein